MKKVQPTLFQSWGTSVTSHASNSKSNSDFANEDDCDLDDETLLAACEEWDSSDDPKHLHGCNSNDTPKHPHGTMLEDLPGFDISAGHIWIYPTNMPVRDYQLNIVEKSLLKNTLVTLPTGLGKTFIAAVVMYNFYRWYPSGKVVFMAPTKPLVAQQIEACYNIMGIPQSHTAEMTGSMNPPERKKVWQSRRVFFLTPQVLMNDLSRKACPANDIKCLVVDEAHKALGNHSYCQVIRELSKYTVNFRVLALSATPGTDLKAVQQVLSNLMIAHIEIRSEDAIDIQKYVHNRTIDKYVVPLGKELESVQEKYLQIISSYVNKLYNAKCLYIKNPKSLTKYQVLMCRDAFRQDPPQHMQRAQQGVAEGQFAILISLYHGYELLMQHGMHSLQCFLTTMVDGTKGISRAKTELMHNHTFCSLMDELNVKFNVEIDETNRSFSSSSIPYKPFVYSHPKLKKLEEIVLEHFNKFKFEASCSSDVKASTRVMIFTQYRDSVHEITKMLNQHNPVVKCMSFVGQSSAGKSTKGFTQKEQLRVVKEFRSGGYNTIVSTCVGEEGLDIGDVDLIVCYDAHKSPIRLVQRMGRTGRKRDGRIVILVTEGKEEQAYNQSLSNKRGIHKALHNSSRKLELYHNNQRMVPKGLNPVVHKMHLTVATAYKSKADRNNAKTSSNQPKIKNFQGQKGKDDSCLNEDELQFWNLHYKLDDHQKELVKTIPTGGQFLTIGNKTSEKKRKSIEFSLSEWSIWQTKKQPVKFVDHSKRCTNFVEVEEFLEVQSFADGEDVYGMEMATFLNKDDVIMQNSQKGIQRFCVSQKCEDKDVKCARKIHDKTDNEVNTTSLNKDLIGWQYLNNNKDHKQNIGGKKKKKTKHLPSLQYSDDDDFEGNDLLPRKSEPGIAKAKSCNNREKINDSNENIFDKPTHSSVQEFNPNVFSKSSEAKEQNDVKEDLLINNIVHNKSLGTDQVDEDKDSDLSIIFPSTQPMNKSLSFENTDKLFPKKFLPPEAPNVTSLDFLDDIDDLEQSLQISLNTINGHMQSLDKPKGKLNSNDTEKKKISGKSKVSEGIQIVKISCGNSKVENKKKVAYKEINVSDVDLDWDFDLSDGENENFMVTEENTVKTKRSRISDVLLKGEGLCVDTSSETNCGEELTQKKNFSTCLTNECLINDKAFQQITEIQGAKEIENKKTEKEELHTDPIDQKFDLQFDLNDFLNEDSDDEIIPPTPAKCDRSKITHLSREKLSRNSSNRKSQNNELIVSHIFNPSNSSTPEHSMHFHSNVSKSRISHDNLQSTTSVSQKNILEHGGIITTNSQAHVQPEASRKIKSTQKTPDNETNSRICRANDADIGTKGIKRKSDPLPAVINDRQKKLKLTEGMQLMTDAAIDCMIVDDKFDSIVHESKPKCTINNKLVEDVADDSEDEIQPKIRKRMNVLSSPVFKTPVKPAKKSKCIVVSSDSEEDKMSSDELSTPLQQRIFKKSSGIKNAVLNCVADDQVDFKEIPDIHKNFAIKKNTTERITKSKCRQKLDNPVHDLLDLEAEVESDAGCSSDEDDISQVDHSIIDFINDNTLCTQGGDLQAIYLQSIKNNDNHTINNRYRLAPQTEYDDDQIFSQVPQQDEDYGDDSFVVYEEDNTKDDTNVNEITINPDNIILAKTRRGKQHHNHLIPTSIEKSKKNKKLTRRRVVIHDSSSEEENIMNHFQVGEANRESKGNKANVDLCMQATSGTDKGNCSFKSSTTLNIRKRNCDKTQEEIAREERIKRQKEKQLEFRKKMAESRKYESTKASAQSTNLINVLKLTDRQTSNKVEIDLVIKNDSTLTDKDLVEHIDNKCTIHGTNEKIEKSSVNHHLNKTSSNLKEEYGVSQKSKRCGGEPVVMVSPGVLSSCPHVASTLELQHNLNSIVHQLNGCDFMVSNRMGIIRKSFSDFANGANRNKLIDQIRYACQLFDRPCLIVETDRVKKPEVKRIINHTKYLDKTISQLIRTHVKLLFTNSIGETASVLADLAHMESRKGFSIQLPENASQRQEQILNLCLSVPCLNFAGALCLSRNCSTFGEIISCSSSQLEVKARISSSRAQDLRQFFKHRFTSEMVINSC